MTLVHHFTRCLLLAVCLGLPAPALAQSADRAAHTHVGGDLFRYGEKLAVVRNANAKVFAAARNAAAEVSAAWSRLAAAPTTRGFNAELTFAAITYVVLTLVILATRRALSGPRAGFRADPMQARGAAGLLGLDVLDRVAVAAAAYLLIEFWCDIETTHDLVVVAALWAFVRWWIALLLVRALLRPDESRFRLLPMSDATARTLTRICAVALAIGIGGISVMPVLLRFELPVEVGQLIVLTQGAMALLGASGLLVYYRREVRTAEADSGRRRAWFVTGALALAAVWVAWSVGALLIKFSVYHALVWSLKIAALAYVLDSILCMAATARNSAAGAGASAMPIWLPLLHRSIRVAAILGILILFAQSWLVDQLDLIAHADWDPIRRSLLTAALTLLVGYALWSYLSQWTESRLHAAVPGLGAADDANRQPASRLTTVLPVLRILLGITIVVLATLVGLSQLGVNIGPLLAGAGVIGLAISFGSQALVRDIVSGIFFMADDAFRVGEYIDTGRLKGTVDKISLRSLRLRHQNGQVHTIPFGQLTSITNFSRDWQTIKFNLRMAPDVDIERVRKTVKQIGLQLLEDPELGKEFLQPLKMQGVAEIADSAIVLRFKFTARPVKPSTLQREALKRIHKAFAEKGIEFSSNAITVKSAGEAPPSLAHAGGAGAASLGADRTAPAAAG